MNQGQGIRPSGEHHQLAVALLNLAAANFEQARHVKRLFARFLRRQHAQHHHLQCHHVHVELGDFVAKAKIVVHALGLGNALQALQLSFGAVDISDVGALVAEQVFGIGPALVFFADEVFSGHLDIVKPHLVHLHTAVQQLDGPHADAFGLHVDQQKADAGLRLALAVGTHQAEDPLAILTQRGPGFLAVDDEFIALAFGFRFERCQVRARARLAVALAPPYVAAGDAGQMALLLRG